jgi:hypothetical protein
MSDTRLYFSEEVVLTYLDYLCTPLIEEMRRANGIDMPPEPRMSEREFDEFCRVHGIKKRADAEARRARKPRRPTLTNVAKQANKAAIEVARYEIKPDGTVVVVTGQGEQHQGNELDQWMAKRARAPERH